MPVLRLNPDGQESFIPQESGTVRLGQVSVSSPELVIAAVHALQCTATSNDVQADGGPLSRHGGGT